MDAPTREELEAQIEHYAALAREQSERLEQLVSERAARVNAVDELLTSIESLGHDLVIARNAADAASRAKAEFLASMSHEMRTPLNAVIGMSALLLETDLTDVQREYAGTIRLAGDHLLSVISDILDYSKIDAGHVELERVGFAIRDVVDEALEIIRGKAHESGLVLASSVDESVPVAVVGDPNRLRQVLLNLLSNAVKFTPSGRVDVSVGTERSSAGAHVVAFSVRDTGIGISPCVLERLFQPFIQGDASKTRARGGTGLGLAISKRLVELMGGTLDAESAPGQGSTFRFTIRVPASAEPSASGRPTAPSAQPEPPKTTFRVLLAEDNVMNQRVATAMLKRLGYVVEAAADGARAVEMLLERPYDLVLMDVEMPNMDGIEATARIRAREGHQPKIVGLTADAFQDTREQCMRAGMDEFLTKPIRMDALAAALRRLLPEE